MKPAKTSWWCLASLVLVAGLSSASCGKDEGTDGGGGHGTVIGGSAGSSAGMIGRGGSTGGTGGSTSATTSKLGQACVSDTQCADPNAPGLTCVTAKDTVLNDGAPPKGLCTMACTVPETTADPDACAELGEGALCYPFDSTSNGYCVEGCAFGAPDIGEADKCHARAEFACNPAFVFSDDAPCEKDADCQSGEVCLNGVCDFIVAACLPQCRGDLDCGTGMYCDQSFLSGVCVAEKPTGKTLGEPCTVPADDEPDEPDECLGFCQRDVAGSNAGHCSTNCAAFRQCSWNAATEQFDGVCLYGSGLAPSVDVGDFGYCTPTCDCTNDCNNDALVCSLLSDGALPDAFRGAGLCFSPDPETVEYNQCAPGGEGGAGGTDGAGGESAGAAGTPAAVGGAGGAP
jgi:hypothetical protein